MFARLFPLGGIRQTTSRPPTRAIAAIAVRTGADPEASFYITCSTTTDARCSSSPSGTTPGQRGADPRMILHPRSVLASVTAAALRDPVRREHDDVTADALGARPPARPASGSSRGARLTLDPAALYGLHDRGVLRLGAKADVNVDRFDRLGLRPPEMAYDLPGEARRVVSGRRATTRTS